MVSEIEPVQDAILETYLYHKELDPGYTRQNGTVTNWRKVYATSCSVHVNENKSVTLLMQEHVVHWNSKAQKAFLADETVTVRTAFITSRDRVAYYFYNYHYNMNGKKVKSHISPITPPESYIYDYFNAFTKQGENPLAKWRGIAEVELGRSISIEAVYPGIELFGRDGFIQLGHRVMRCRDAYEACDLIFGKSRRRKDLVRAVGKLIRDGYQQRAHILSWVELFKKSVPIDWLVLALNKPHPDLEMAEELTVPNNTQPKRTTFREILDQLKPNERKNILLNTHGTRQGYLLSDTIRQWRMLHNTYGQPFPVNRDNIKNLHQLHDVLTQAVNDYAAEQRRRYQIEAYKPEKMKIWNDDLNEYASAIEADGRFDIRFARDYDTLIDWSTYMNNCISSYFNSSALLAGVYRDGVLYANLEIRVSQDRWATDDPRWNFELHQLLGKHNLKLDHDDKLVIEEFLQEFGVGMYANRWS